MRLPLFRRTPWLPPFHEHYEDTLSTNKCQERGTNFREQRLDRFGCPSGCAAQSAGLARAILFRGGGSEERASSERRTSEGGREPPSELFHGAGGEAGDVVVEGKNVEDDDGDGAEDRAGHQLAPEVDVAADHMGPRVRTHAMVGTK